MPDVRIPHGKGTEDEVIEAIYLIIFHNLLRHF